MRRGPIRVCFRANWRKEMRACRCQSTSACAHEPIDQPFRDTAPGPILSRPQRGQDLHRKSVALGHIDAQARQAGSRRPRAGVVNTDIAGECPYWFQHEGTFARFTPIGSSRAIKSLSSHPPRLKHMVSNSSFGPHRTENNFWSWIKPNIQKIWWRRTPGNSVLCCRILVVIRKFLRLLKRGKIRDGKAFDTCLDGTASDVLYKHRRP